MEGSADTVVVRDAPERSRYEAELGGDLAGTVDYRLKRNRIVLDHTTVEPAFEGRGVGSRLARAVLDDARDRGLLVAPRCPFMAAWMRAHPEYLDLVPEDRRYLLEPRDE
jgi:predicted GNAT family acetyltransferase